MNSFINTYSSVDSFHHAFMADNRIVCEVSNFSCVEHHKYAQFLMCRKHILQDPLMQSVRCDYVIPQVVLKCMGIYESFKGFFDDVYIVDVCLTSVVNDNLKDCLLTHLGYRHQ